jgi:hypothetical protein
MAALAEVSGRWGAGGHQSGESHYRVGYIGTFQRSNFLIRQLKFHGSEGVVQMSRAGRTHNGRSNFLL